MKEISNHPLGILSMLNAKERGQAFAGIAEELIGVVEMRELYLLNRREFVDLGSVVGVVDGPNFFTLVPRVPTGELWYVWGGIAAANTGAATSLTVALGYNPEGNTLTLPSGDYAVGGFNQNVVGTNRSPFWAGPGTSFSALCQDVVGAVTAVGALIATKLRV